MIDFTESEQELGASFKLLRNVISFYRFNGHLHILYNNPEIPLIFKRVSLKLLQVDGKFKLMKPPMISDLNGITPYLEPGNDVLESPTIPDVLEFLERVEMVIEPQLSAFL